MSWKINVVWVFIVWFSCEQKKPPAIIEESDYVSTEHLIEAKDFVLQMVLTRPWKTVIDFRKKSAYQKGHIPGAVNIYRSDINNRDYPYGGMMPSKEQLEHLLSDLGVSYDDELIIYDDKLGCDAARLWWVLDYHGFDNVKILNGGLMAWIEENGDTTIVEPEIIPTEFRFREVTKKETFVSLDEVTNRTENVKLLDTRTPDEYSGKRQKKGAANAGRIPDAQLIDWANAVDYHGDGKFKSVNELNDIYQSAGFDKTDTIYVYCHSGVRSAHTTFVLTELLGYQNVKNYDGSWTEWSHHTQLPVERDSIATLID